MSALSYSTLALPSRETQQREFGRRELLPPRTDLLWKIERGIVRAMTWLEDGTTVTLGLWGPGDLVGQRLSKTDPYQLECLTRVAVMPVGWHEWEQNPELLLSRMQQAEELLIIRSHRRIDEMLLKLLAWLAHRFGHEEVQGKVIDLRLTHQDMAELLGTTRVTITRILKQLEQQGMIEWAAPRKIVLREEEVWHYQI